MTCAIGQAQHAGLHFVRSYESEDFGGRTQVWCAIQDDRGVMYFGNTGGAVLEYDGENWAMIFVPNRTTVRSLAKSPSGQIYVGYQQGFGKLVANAQGEWEVQSLLATVPEEYRQFQDVWDIYIRDGYVYFCSFATIFKYDPQRDTSAVISPTGSGFHLAFELASGIYVKQSGHLAKLTANGLDTSEHPLSKLRANCYDMLELPDGNVLVTTTGNELLIYHPEDGTAKIFESEVTEELKKGVPYKLKRKGDKIIVSTLGAGIYILDLNGSLISHMDAKNGLLDDQVWGLYEDRQQGLWACLNNGISKIEFGSPITHWEAKQEMGKPYDVLVSDQKLLIAASRGLFFLDQKPNVFRKINQGIITYWTLAAIVGSEGKPKQVLAGTSQGILQIPRSSTEPPKIVSAFMANVYAIQQSDLDPNRIFYGAQEEFGVMERNGDTWVPYPGSFPKIKDEIRAVSEGKKGDLWLSSRYNGLYHLIPTQDGYKLDAQLDTADGLISNSYVSTFKLDDQILIVSDQQMLYYDTLSKRIIPYNPPYEALAKFGIEASEVKMSRIDQSGWYWFFYKNRLSTYDPKRQAIDTNSYDQVITGEVNTIYHDSLYDQAFVANANTLYQIDLSQHRPNVPIVQSIAPLIRQLSISGDSIVFKGNTGLSQQGYALTHTQAANIKISYAAPVFDGDHDQQYSVYLQGLDKTWSAWSDKTEKEYTNLHEGTYRFRVKFRDGFGHEGGETSLQLTVSPPWYRYKIAYASYLVLGIMVVVLLIQGNALRLRRANIKLEKIVETRTQEIKEKSSELASANTELQAINKELVQQREAIQSQKEVIDKQNKTLSDTVSRLNQSMEAAKLIQQALLPFAERLHKAFGEQYFVINIPKDVVSGDFYWLYQKHDIKILVVVDCVGHGIPGALMSAIGHSLLERAVVVNSLTNPARILEAMDQLVLRALSAGNGQDIGGMDMAVLVMTPQDDQRVHLEFAGARRPFFYYDKDQGKVTEIKGTRRPVGWSLKKKREFEKHEMILDKGCSIYLGSDGFEDQQNQQNKKIGRIGLLHELNQIATLPMDQQEAHLSAYLRQHMEGALQRDDILLMGIQI